MLFYHFILKPLERVLRRPLLIAYPLFEQYYLDAHPSLTEHQKFWEEMKKQKPNWKSLAQKWKADGVKGWCPEFATLPQLLCWAYELFLEMELDEKCVQLVLDICPPTPMTWEQRLEV